MDRKGGMTWIECKRLTVLYRGLQCYIEAYSVI